MLCDPGNASNNPDAALREFAVEIQSYCREERSLSERTRTLRVTRSELVMIQRRFNGTDTSAVIEQALSLIDCELDIVKMELEHPERFMQPESHTPLAKWNGTVSELLELAVSVHSAGKFSKPTGEPMVFSDVVTLVESIFGITISRPYERKSKLFSRKKDETPFLRNLITVFRTAAEKFHQ